MSHPAVIRSPRRNIAYRPAAAAAAAAGRAGGGVPQHTIVELASDTFPSDDGTLIRRTVEIAVAAGHGSPGA